MSQTIEIPDLPSGETGMTAKVITLADAVVETINTVTELTYGLGGFRVAATTSNTGWHKIRIDYSDATHCGTWYVYLTGSTSAIHYATDLPPGTIVNAGSGARTVSITVDDGSDPLESANVRLTKGAESYVASTDANGLATFYVDDGTWTVVITLAGYSFTSTTLVVDGNETATYSMTAQTPAAPSDPALSTGYVYCYGTDGEVEEGVEITCYMLSGPGTTGYSHDNTEFVMTSDANGLASGPLVRTATYRARRGEDGREVEFTVADAGTYAMPEILGTP